MPRDWTRGRSAVVSAVVSRGRRTRGGPSPAVESTVAQHDADRVGEEVCKGRCEGGGASVGQHPSRRIQAVALPAAAEADEAGVRRRGRERGGGGVPRERKHRRSQRLGKQEKVALVCERRDAGRRRAVHEESPLLHASAQRLKVLDCPVGSAGGGYGRSQQQRTCIVHASLRAGATPATGLTPST